MEKLTMEEEMLLEFLGVGEARAKTASQIPMNSRRLRMAVSSLRKKNWPICSGDGGYWLAEDPTEIYRTKSQIDARIKELVKVSVGLSRAARIKEREQ